jgi:ribonuclease R
LAEDLEGLKKTGEHISLTERRSMMAERDTTDRYLAAYLADRLGTEVAGRISGIARFGMFVKLDGSGADGLVPIATLGREYFTHDRDAQTLTGERSKTVIKLGQRVLTRLAEATPVTGGLVLELLELEGKPLPQVQGGRGRGPKRQVNKSRAKGSKLKKKLKRKRV